MSGQFFVINLREYIDNKDSPLIAENKLDKLLSCYSCPLNPDVEHFLSITLSNSQGRINLLPILYFVKAIIMKLILLVTSLYQ